MNIWLIAASGFSALTTLIHFFAGGRNIARPLLDAQDIETVPKLVNYLCWHMATMVLFAAVLVFGYGAFHSEAAILVFAFSLMSGASALIVLGIIARYQVSLFAMPQWILLGGMAALGFAGSASA